MAAYNIEFDEQTQELIENLKTEIETQKQTIKTQSFNLAFYRAKINQLIAVVGFMVVVVIIALAY